MPLAPSVTPYLAALIISLVGVPVLAQSGDRSWEVRLEAHGGYGGVTNLSASTGGVQVHGPAASGAVAVTWPLSGRVHGGVRIGCVLGLGMAGQSFYRDESGAPATSDAYGVYAAFQGVVPGRWLTFRFAPGLGVLHLSTDEEPSREYAGAASHDTTYPELILSVGLDLNLGSQVALTVSAEVGTLLVQTRGNILAGVVVRL